MKLSGKLLCFLIFLFAASCSGKSGTGRLPETCRQRVDAQLEIAGDNKTELVSLIRNAPQDQLEAIGFLLANMPERDLQTLSAGFLSEHIQGALACRQKMPWGKVIPDDIFLNNVLPYASINERRDSWRKDFFDRFYPLVKDCQTPSEAVLILNEKIWDLLNVHYSTKRPKPDQSPYESIEATTASCTGLSILLVDVCRSVGIPARFIGIPRWVYVRGNHSWVEIWDGDWHFVGAAEPGPLNVTWFADRAQFAIKDDPAHSIYAASFRKTDILFPLLWEPDHQEFFAENVTDHYARDVQYGSSVRVSVRVFNGQRERISVPVRILYKGDVIASGKSADKNRDTNDILTFSLKKSEKYTVEAGENFSRQQKIETGDDPAQLVELNLE